ncbi:pimeloyl-ACP methyl ester esterase BioH [Pseudomarimonas arenosa]|uniref:Pimeloyl-[acyl-carrier protein] methyl ester esterase n=1 Tax=Pseudomarimonas arenosa TaxID=2774145 RepID=A0AAW3ZIM0_9GAMM|nr:pimeloyl-ACP methyl ester esterase BioH [Pseudomarimonas arenosa]MBD8525841.1 pimeloyl-ACP methyl ester esterase BioH [Pseudomarimonas arenosa]
MHVDVVGKGPPLVMLHGWAMHGGIFRPLSQRLQQHFELHLVDLPGHGHSRALSLALDRTQVIDQLLDALPCAPWLGWSLGGLLAIEAALLRPERLQGLIVLCGSPCFVRREHWPHAVEAEVFRQFARDLAADYAATIDRFIALEAHGSDQMRADLRELRAHVFDRGEPDPAILSSGLSLLEQGDCRAGLSTLNLPSLWLAGRRDRLVPWQGMQQAAELCGGAYARIESGGHAPFLSHADEVAALIYGFQPSCR